MFKTHNLLFTKNTCIKLLSSPLFSKRENFLNLQFISTKTFPTHLLSKLLIKNNISSHLNKKHIQGHMCEFASIGHLKHLKKRKLHMFFSWFSHTYSRQTHVFFATLLLSIIQMIPPHPPNSIGHMSHVFLKCFH